MTAADPAPRRIEVRAPAKLNLGLRVTGRRADGYHELDSVFVPLDWVDELSLGLRPAEAPRATLEIESGLGGVPPGPENLASRAARAFLESAGLDLEVSIRLRKRIPLAAGLGGGSSDAGAVLRGLAELYPDALTAAALAELALDLGADVPFFLDPRPARVRGVGERIEPLAGLPPLALLLAHPGEPLSTREVYRAYDALSAEGAAAPPAEGPVGPLSGVDLHNDLEPAAVRLCPAVARLRQALRALDPLGVGMSGSGPTVYGVFPNAERAAAAARELRFEAPCWGRVARSVGSR